MARTQTITLADRELLALIQDHGPLTRYGVSKALGRKPATVYRQIKKLLDLGLLVDQDGQVSVPGTQAPEPQEPPVEEIPTEMSFTVPEPTAEIVELPTELEVRMIDTSAVKDVEKICAEMTAKYPANAWDIYVAIRDLGPLTLEEIEDVTGESRFYIGYICLQLTQKGILLRGQYVDEFWGPVPEDPADLPAAREAMGRKWQELELKKRRKDVQQTNEKFRGQSWYSEVSLPTNVLPYPENFVVSSW